VNWLSIFIGVLIGWLAEWLIDVLYWRKRGRNQASGQGAEFESADLEFADERSMARRLRDSEILFQDCWRTLEERTGETDRLKAQIAALQAERRGLPMAPAAGAAAPQKAAMRSSSGAAGLTVLRASTERSNPVPVTKAETATQPPAAVAPEIIPAPPEAALFPAAAATAAVSPAPAAAEPLAAATMNDLELIEGISPKIGILLQQNGITTFAQLADCDVANLHRILELGGKGFQAADPDTWPEQARLIMNGDWDALKTLQDRLSAGNER
jgi:predicted flap endonuclease-1-like 5' DNA nuclease